MGVARGAQILGRRRSVSKNKRYSFRLGPSEKFVSPICAPFPKVLYHYHPSHLPTPSKWYSMLILWIKRRGGLSEETELCALSCRCPALAARCCAEAQTNQSKPCLCCKHTILKKCYPSSMVVQGSFKEIRVLQRHF